MTTIYLQTFPDFDNEDQYLVGGIVVYRTEIGIHRGDPRRPVYAWCVDDGSVDFDLAFRRALDDALREAVRRVEG